MMDWNIRSRSHSCHGCRKEFADGERCCSVVADINLTEIPDSIKENLPAAVQAQTPKAAAGNNSEYVRIDLCAGCRKEYEDKDWISSWQSIYTPPAPPAPEPLPRETAESLLRRLLEDERSHENASVIFVLAVMLERKKILIERTVRKSVDGMLLRVYEHKKSGEILLIADPDLQAEEIPFVQQRINELLTPPAGSPGDETGNAENGIADQADGAEESGAPLPEPQPEN